MVIIVDKVDLVVEVAVFERRDASGSARVFDPGHGSSCHGSIGGFLGESARRRRRAVGGGHWTDASADRRPEVWRGGRYGVAEEEFLGGGRRKQRDFPKK